MLFIIYLLKFSTDQISLKKGGIFTSTPSHFSRQGLQGIGEIPDVSDEVKQGAVA
jgi:hypothetical protein